MSENWTQSLKAGDEVVVTGRFYGHDRLARVDRVTATQIVVGNERFRRDSGRRVGDSGYAFAYIVEPVAQRREAIERRMLTDAITRANFDKLPLETLRAAHELLCKRAP